MKATSNVPTGHDSDNPTNGTSDPRDPHAAWWIEHRQINAELDTWSYSHPDDQADESTAWQARADRVNELEKLLCNTPISTFEGANVLRDVLRHELADDRLEEGLHQLFVFLMSIESALRCHDLQDQVEWWFWRHQCVEAPIWKGHPRQPIGRKYREQNAQSELAELEEKVARLKGRLDPDAAAGDAS